MTLSYRRDIALTGECRSSAVGPAAGKTAAALPILPARTHATPRARRRL